MNTENTAPGATILASRTASYTQFRQKHSFTMMLKLHKLLGVDEDFDSRMEDIIFAAFTSGYMDGGNYILDELKSRTKKEAL